MSLDRIRSAQEQATEQMANLHTGRVPSLLRIARLRPFRSNESHRYHYEHCNPAMKDINGIGDEAIRIQRERWQQRD